MNPKISIIVPVYNVEKFLPQCIDSVLAQTYQDFEVILVDDGSPDGSPAICEEYAKKDARVHVLHQKNAGVSTARNNGISAANGEWVTFIDSDDWVAPNYLANFGLDDIDGIDLIMQGIVYYDHRDGHFFKPWHFSSGTYMEKDFVKVFADNDLLSFGFPYCKAIRRRFMIENNMKFDQRLAYHEDHIFVLELYQHCHSVRLIDATDYKYRCYHTGTSLSSRRHAWEKMNIAGDEMLKRVEAMVGKFHTKGSAASKKILTASYKNKMIAAESVVLSNLSYSERSKLFHTIIKKSQLVQCYFPVARRPRLTAFLYTNCPFMIVNLYHHLIQYARSLKNISKQ